jgi:cytoskeletal protein RodZ
MDRKPVFSNKGKMKKMTRKLLGIFCTLVCLAIIFGVSYILENFKQQAIREKKRAEMNRLENQPVEKDKKQAAKPAAEKAEKKSTPKPDNKENEKKK